MADNDQTSVRVAVRVRPQTSKERAAREHDTVACIPETRQAVVGDRSFTFDYLYDQTSTQEEIYEKSVSPLVEAALAGYNATVFAYGQTGSGKTYTMGSSSWNDLEPDQLGLLPRALKHIFDERLAKHAHSSGPAMVLRASFIEIHNEELKDLLAAGRGGSGGASAGGGLSAPSGALAGRGRGLQIREDANGGIYFAGAEEAEVVSFEDVRMLLEQGTARRATGSTEMNAHSSRSHAIFTLTIEQHVVRDVDADAAAPGEATVGEVAVGAEEEYITSKFHFVDLAGSERLKKTKAEGERLKEGININSGLLALGNVISALGDETRMRQGAHVAYRDSKLTRMLQDSLGGNSRTLMIACVSPVDSNSEESKSTLQYANRARNIKNKPVINRDPNSHLIAQLRKEVAGLRGLLQDNGIYATLSGAAPAPGAQASGSLEGPSAAGAAAREREASLREQVVRFEVQVAEQAKLIDDFKLGMAQMYTSATAMQEEMHVMRSNLQNAHKLEQTLTAVDALVNSILQIEERCRTKMVVHAAWMPSAGNAAASAMSSSGDKSARHQGPAILRRFAARTSSGGTQGLSPRDAATSFGAHATQFDGSRSGSAAVASPGSGGGGGGGGGGGISVPPLALDGLSQLNLTGDEGDECLATDRTDGGSRQLLSDGTLISDGMRDMDAVLIEKERLLHELVRNQRDFDTMRNAYERKMQHLQLSIRAIEEERDQTAKELESLDQRPALTSRTSEDKERQRVRLRQLEDELKRLRKKVKDHERLLSFKEQGDQKIAKLSQEVEQLKNARNQLHKKMAREAKGFREHKQELEKQIVTLRKADMSSRKVIRELQTKLSSKERGEHILRRRAQIAMEKKKLSLEKEKERDWGKGRGKALDVDADVVEWFHAHLAQASRKEAARDQLETSTNFRQQLDKALTDCQGKMAGLERALVGGVKDRSSVEQELQDLRDESEYLMAELDFRAVELERAKKHLADADKAAREVPDALAHMSDIQVRRLANASYEECVQNRISLQKKTDKLHESEVALLEARRSLQEAGLQAQALREAHDSEKTKIEQQYEEKLAFIMQHLQEEQAHLKSPTLHASSASLTPRTPSSQAASADDQTFLRKKGVGAGGMSPLGQETSDWSPTSPSDALSSADASAGAGSARRNTFQVANVYQQQVSPVLRADTTGLQGLLESIRAPAGSARTPTSTASPGAPAGVPTLPIASMHAADAEANSGTGRPSASSARESSARREAARDRDSGRPASRTARGQASQSHVSSVQAMVIEKADKILAEKSRFAVQGRRGSDPGIGSLAEPGGGGSSGGVGVVKLDLDLLRAASNSSTPAPDAGSAAGDSGGRQSELSNVMQVLSGAAGGARSGERKLAKGPAGKGDRRARVELLKDKVWAVWEALGVSEEERGKFRNQVAALSTKPDAALQVYQQEYTQLMKQVSEAVEEARRGIEQGWQQLGIGPEARERSDFERKFLSLLAPEHELDALNLARSELLLVEHRAENTRSIQKSLHKRLEILRRLTEAAKDAPGAAAHQDGLRKMVRDYPKIVERLKTQLTKWQQSENRVWMLGQVSALEVLEKGDDELVYRAMHSKLMNSHHKSASKLDKPAGAGPAVPDAQGSEGIEGEAHGALQHAYMQHEPKHAAENGEALEGCSNQPVPDAARKEHRQSASARPSTGSERAAERRDDVARAGSSPGVRGQQQLRKSTTSAMAIRFEALKQTYAQVRSRSSCLARGDGSGRQELMRRALEDRGLLSLGGEQASPQKGPAQAQGDGDDAAPADGGQMSPPSRPMQAWGAETQPRDPDEQWGGAAAYLDSQRFKS